jgi:transcriptional regulator with XRE-family HTH domain
MVDNQIKTIRKEIGMTQDELAVRSGITRAMLSKLERGEKADCKYSTMTSISNALGRPVADIFLLR